MKRKILYIVIALIILGVAGVGAAMYGDFVREKENIPLDLPSNDQPAEKTPPKGEVILTSPKEGEVVASPLQVTGEAPGTWYFEASFPIKVTDENFKQLGIGIAQAQKDWMTTEQVPFKAVVEFNPGNAKSGWIILEKDNPSGLPENAGEFKVPVKFGAGEASGGQSGAFGGCKITGCSGQVCADRDVSTTCEYKAEYACYRTARCERQAQAPSNGAYGQASGACGWTQTKELRDCLAKN